MERSSLLEVVVRKTRFFELLFLVLLAPNAD